MKKKIIIFILIGLILVGAVLFFKLYPPQANQSHFAFLKSTWGMSPQEVEVANGVKLEPFPNPGFFYPAEVGAKQSLKYSVLQEINYSFLGRDAKVVYVFFDSKLLSYYLLIHDRDPEILDKEMTGFLKTTFGANYLSVGEEHAPLKLVWTQKEYLINYWLFRETLSVSNKYTACYGVIYRPLKEKLTTE